MSILKMNTFQQTLKGRIISFLLALVILNLNSCTVYTSSETNLEYVRNTEQIQQNLDVYKFYVHDQYGSYQLNNPIFNQDGSISGDLIPVNYQKPDSTWSNKERKAYWSNHKYDIGIYTRNTVSDLRADLNNNALTQQRQSIKISGQEIEKMTITSINKEDELGAAALVVLIILGVIVVLGLMVILITVTATASSDGSDSSSDGSSDGSDSNSDSGSGGSGSSG